MMAQLRKYGFPFVSTVGRSLVVAVYLLCLVFGLLCVLYHLFFIWYSSLDGDPLPLLGVMLALANLIYPACIVGLLVSSLVSKRRESLIFKPQVWITLLFMAPVILYLNYVLVESLALYNYSL